jgi:hypothetical protein
MTTAWPASFSALAAVAAGTQFLADDGSVNGYATGAQIAEYVRTLTQTMTNKTFTTPVLGVATATSINKVAITAPATGSTLTIADGKTLTASNSLTFTGTDSTSFAFPATSGSVALTDLAQTITKARTYSEAGAASAPVSYWTGTILTGGTGTTNFPHIFVQPTGATASTTWSTAGTVFGANLATGFTGNLADLKVAGVSQFSITNFGKVLAGDGASTPTAGTPGMAFAGATGVGFRRSGTSSVYFTSSSADIWFSTAVTLNMRSNGTFAFSQSADPGDVADVLLARDAANTLALRNSTNAQTFNVYNTFTNSSNYERLQFGFNSNIPFITSTPLGTGTQRALNLQRVATPASGSSSAAILLGTTAAFGIYYGSGAPTVTAAQGSIYLRSDGSSVATRLYVNTDGATTWTPFTSAA